MPAWRIELDRRIDALGPNPASHQIEAIIVAMQNEELTRERAAVKAAASRGDIRDIRRRLAA